jgi:hypothetical protein
MTRAAAVALAATAAAAAAAVLPPGAARADTPLDRPSAIEADRDEAPPGRTELGFDGGAPVGGWGVTLGAGWLERPLVLRGAAGETEPVRRRETVSLGGALARGSRWRTRWAIGCGRWMRGRSIASCRAICGSARGCA